MCRICGQQSLGSETYTSIPNPATCNSDNGQTNRSHRKPRLTIQIPNVLQVSMVLRVVAETLLVTLKPKKLKLPMLIQIATEVQITVVFPMI